jgi:hypothetical protein
LADARRYNQEEKLKNFVQNRIDVENCKDKKESFLNNSRRKIKQTWNQRKALGDLLTKEFTWASP